MAYSKDFRECVLESVSGGMTWSASADLFKISRDCIKRWLYNVSKYGDIMGPPHKSRTPRKIEPSRLLAELEQKPDATLHELAAVFGCWPSAVEKRLKNLGVTRKKNQAIRGALRRKKA